jgi:Flp pilus assembly protein TadG
MIRACIQRLSRFVRPERGSVLVMAAVGVVVVCGFAGLSIDVGNVAVDRRHLQNAADAAALAAAQQLPASTTNATADATSWMAKNGYAGAGAATVVSSSTYTANDTVTVTGSDELRLFIAPLVGKESASVTAMAKAIIGSMAGGSGLVPFGLLKDHNPR